MWNRIDLPFEGLLQAIPGYVHFTWNILYKTKQPSASLTHPQEPVWLTGNREPEEAQRVDAIPVGSAKAGCARVGEM